MKEKKVSIKASSSPITVKTVKAKGKRRPIRKAVRRSNGGCILLTSVSILSLYPTTRSILDPRLAFNDRFNHPLWTGEK